MSDQVTSGTPSEALAATAGATASVASSGTSQPTGAFGSTRGSGLARGKRAPAPTAPAAGAASSGYKPSALEVMAPKSEYVNPFTGETSVAAPVINEPAPQAAPVAEVIASVAPSAPAPAVVSAAAAPAAELFPFTPAAPAREGKPAVSAPESTEKAELKILPPQEAKRPVAQSWEAPASGQTDRRPERPTFRPEKREIKPYEPRTTQAFNAAPAPRNDERKFEPREPRHQGSQAERGPRPERDARPAPQAAPIAPEKKSGGFVGWFKGLFASGETAAPSPARPAGNDSAPARSAGGDRRSGDGRGRGRGQGGFRNDSRGPRDGQSSAPRPSGGQPLHHNDPRDGGDEGSGGEGRRRRRGGRGRNRGEGGGDRGPDPRAEGQQGGGAI